MTKNLKGIRETLLVTDFTTSHSMLTNIELYCRLFHTVVKEAQNKHWVQLETLN